MALSRVSSSLSPAASAMQIRVLGEALFHVNVPTRDQATVAVAQVRDALNSTYLSPQSLRARVTSNNDVNNRAIVAFRVLEESPLAQEVVAQVVSDPSVFAAIWGKIQEIPELAGKMVETVKRIKDASTSCLIPRDREDLAEDYESSSTDRISLRIGMFQKVVDAIIGVWDQIVGLFAGNISGIQEAFAGKGIDAEYLETAHIIVRLSVLVTVVIVVGAILVL